MVMGLCKRKEFIGGVFALGASCALGALPAPAAGDSGRLKIRFLGTGAADWNGRNKRGELRRWTSLLVDDAVLIDFTPSNADMLPPGCRPEAIFYTHSHPDHYNPAAAVSLGVPRAYVHESWSNEAAEEFHAAGGCCVAPLRIGEAVEAAGLRLTPLPANHATDRREEQALIYLIEKGPARLLYATDTAGIPALAARLAGIDAHDKPGRQITALVMEATLGMGRADDFRLFTHSSVETVAQTVRVLEKTGRYAPAPGQSVYLTHLARTLHGTQAKLDATLPAPLKAAYDGLEVLL